MKTFCDYCGSVIEDTVDQCPNCGAVNKHVMRSGNQVPKTIEELKAFAAEKNIPLEKMRFFIGIDYKEPKAFGIYKEPNGNFVVYKNKGNGERAVRYHGTDEAYAVNEIYQKMKAELLEHKQADINRASKTPVKTTSSSSSKKKKGSGLGCGAAVLIFIFAFFIVGMIAMAIDDAKSPKKGYYDYNGDAFYYSGAAWYAANDDGVWERENDVPDVLENNYNDYFEAKDYYNLDADYADDVAEYETEAYSYDNDNDDDSWFDSDWDDDDWDYDYDSYDYDYDSDWDSDW